MKLTGLLSLFLFFTVAGQAQTIKGTLMDPVEGVVVKDATVQLLSPTDSAAIRSTVSDASGSFLFTNVSRGHYILKATSIGFETLLRSVALNDSTPSLDLDDVHIPKKTTTLEGVVIVASAPAVSQKGDTTQFAASQYKVNPDATVEDLIKKMPGITVAKDGTVTGQGEQIKKVTVDGKDFFGDDATTALRNLPAEVVDKIQLFDRLSEQAQLTGFDDGNAVKAINIVTRGGGGMRNSQFGRIYAGYGTDNRYQAGGNTSFFNGDRRISLVGNFNNINQQNFGQQDLLGIMSGGRGRGYGGGYGGGNMFFGQQDGISRTNAFGINYSDKWSEKFNVSGSYFFNNSKNENETDRFSPTVTTDDRILNLTNNSKSASVNNEHRFNMRFEFKPDSNNTIMYMPNWSFQNYNSESSNYTSSVYADGDSSYISNGNSRSERSGYNIGNNLMYRRSLGKQGRTFFAFLRADFSKNDGESYNLTNIEKFEDIQLPDVRNQYRTNPTRSSNFSARLNYTEPVGKEGMMEFSYTPSVRITKRDQETFDYDGAGYNLPNQAQSNVFENKITTHNGGINYRLGRGRDNQFSAGFDLQYSNLSSDRVKPMPATIDQNFFAFLPNLRWSKKLGRYGNMRIYYRAGTDFPSIDQLQDVIDSSNQTSIWVGNPNLKQAYTHRGTARYIYANTKNNTSFTANVSFNIADNYITTDVVNEKGITNTTYINLNGYQSYSGLLVYSFPIRPIKSNFNITTNYSYGNTPSKYNGKIGFVTRNTMGGGAVLSSNISEYIDFTLGYDVNYTKTSSTLRNASSGQNYLQQSPSATLNLLSQSGWFLNTNIAYQNYKLENADGVEYTLWNAAIGKKFLSKKQAELKLSVFDILKQNNSFSQTLNNFNLIQTTTTKVLQQYFMLTFTYSLRSFGKANPSRESEERRDWQGGPHRGGMTPGGARPGGGPMF
ncbi:outer membrane beta-barrel protein [Niabella aquatica]